MSDKQMGPLELWQPEIAACRQLIQTPDATGAAFALVALADYAEAQQQRMADLLAATEEFSAWINSPAEDQRGVFTENELAELHRLSKRIQAAIVKAKGGQSDAA